MARETAPDADHPWGLRQRPTASLLSRCSHRLPPSLSHTHTHKHNQIYYRIWSTFPRQTRIERDLPHTSARRALDPVSIFGAGAPATLGPVSTRVRRRQQAERVTRYIGHVTRSHPRVKITEALAGSDALVKAPMCRECTIRRGCSTRRPPRKGRESAHARVRSFWFDSPTKPTPGIQLRWPLRKDEMAKRTAKRSAEEELFSAATFKVTPELAGQLLLVRKH